MLCVVVVVSADDNERVFSIRTFRRMDHLAFALSSLKEVTQSFSFVDMMSDNTNMLCVLKCSIPDSMISSRKNRNDNKGETANRGRKTKGNTSHIAFTITHHSRKETNKKECRRYQSLTVSIDFVKKIIELILQGLEFHFCTPKI